MKYTTEEVLIQVHETFNTSLKGYSYPFHFMIVYV